MFAAHRISYFFTYTEYEEILFIYITFQVYLSQVSQVIC